MTRFYVTSEGDAKRCREAIVDRRPITISGTTENGLVKGFTGVVQSVDEDEKRNPSKRWRVTMLDAQITEPGYL